MIEGLLSWLQTKGQIDFGNALVGLGGLVLAWATVSATKSAQRTAQQTLEKQANSKIAEFRMSWIATLRDDISEYVKLHRNIELIRSKSSSGKVPVDERDRLLDLLAVRAKIQTMLKEDPVEISEKSLLELISKDVPEASSDAKEHRMNIVKLTRSVLKREWNKVKTEIRT